MPNIQNRYKELCVQVATRLYESLTNGEEGLDDFLQTLPPVMKDKPPGEGWNLVLVPRNINLGRLSMSWPVYARPYVMTARYGTFVHASKFDEGVVNREDYYWVWLSNILTPVDESDESITCELTVVELCAMLMQYPQVFNGFVEREASVLCGGSALSLVVDGSVSHRKLVVSIYPGICVIDVQPQEGQT